MECNVGTLDKVLRVIIGIAIIGTGLYFNSWFGLIGLIPIATALFGKCLLYYPFGITTCRNK